MLTSENAPSRKGKQTTIKANAATKAYHPWCFGLGLIFISFANVKEHAPSLAGASVETEVKP